MIDETTGEEIRKTGTTVAAAVAESNKTQQPAPASAKPGKWTGGEGLGPRMAKQLNEAIRDLTSEGQTHDKLSGIVGCTEGWQKESHSSYMILFGAARPETAVIARRIGEKYGWTATGKNYRAIMADFAAGVVELRASRPVVDERRTQEQENERMAESNRIDAERKAEHEKQAAIDRQNESKWAAEFPHLERANRSTKSRWALAAANIRTELQAKYPGQVFSVTSSSYSGGCSIDIGWSDGPVSKDVDKIAQKYSTAHFDGMQDLETSTSTHWNTVFGGAKYIFANRSIGVETQTALMPWAQERVAAGDMWCQHDASGLAWQLWQSHGLPVGAVVKGVEARGDAEGGAGNDPAAFWRIVYDLPATPPPLQITTPAASSGDGSITVSQNEAKNGVEIRFASKPAADVLAGLKARGFRWAKFARVWYHRRDAASLAYAYELAGQAVPETSGGDPVDMAYEDQCARAVGM